MNRNIKFTFVICIIVIITITSFYSKNNTNDLFLDNIEALANGESGGGDNWCYLNGSVDCRGVKAAYTQVGR